MIRRDVLARLAPEIGKVPQFSRCGQLRLGRWLWLERSLSAFISVLRLTCVQLCDQNETARAASTPRSTWIPQMVNLHELSIPILRLPKCFQAFQGVTDGSRRRRAARTWRGLGSQPQLWSVVTGALHMLSNHHSVDSLLYHHSKCLRAARSSAIASLPPVATLFFE